jgi:hypothetical protein
LPDLLKQLVLGRVGGKLHCLLLKALLFGREPLFERMPLGSSPLHDDSPQARSAAAEPKMA